MARSCFSEITGPMTNTTKGQTFPPEPLTRAEVSRLIGASSGTSSTGLRNRALFWTLYRGGLRLSEALALRPKDLDEPSVRILHGKGDKPRTVAMTPDAWAAVRLWLERRDVPRGSTVFCTLQGEALDQAYVRKALGRCRVRAGIEKRVHAHGFRHTLASELVEEGQPLPLVQQVLGHADLGTTARYLQRIGATPHVVAAMTTRPTLQCAEPDAL